MADGIRVRRADDLAAVTATNHGLHAERRAREAAAAAAAAGRTAAHVAKEEANPFLREDTRLAVSAADPRRFRPDHFKGFPAAAVAGIYAELDACAAAAAAAAEEESKRKAEEEASAAALATAAAAVASAIDAERAARNVAYYADLAAAASARRAADATRRAADRERQVPTATGILAGFGKSLR